jgi:nucleoside-diphosphate-sugar epimerase
MTLASLLEQRDGLRRELQLATPIDRGVTLLHLAAMVPVAKCEADPERAWQTNVEHTCATILDVAAWALGRGVPLRVIYVSSGHVYAEPPVGRLARETDPLGPRSTYAHTKRAAEERLAELSIQNGFGLRVARVFGLVAPAQPPTYVLPGLMRRVREGRLQDIPGLSYVRDYLDARDVCEALLDLAKTVSWDRPETLNVCSGRGISLREMLTFILHALRPTEADGLLASATEAPGRPDDIRWLVGDPSRLRAALGREPARIRLEETIDEAAKA